MSLTDFYKGNRNDIEGLIGSFEEGLKNIRAIRDHNNKNHGQQYSEQLDKITLYSLANEFAKKYKGQVAKDDNLANELANIIKETRPTGMYHPIPEDLVSMAPNVAARIASEEYKNNLADPLNELNPHEQDILVEIEKLKGQWENNKNGKEDMTPKLEPELQLELE